jgi:hypothetical protein
MEVVRRKIEAGAKWSLSYLKVAAEEGRKILTQDVQYDHAVDQVELLACEDDPTHPKALLEVQQHGDFYELKEKGGVLRKINLRVYFILVDRPTKTLWVIGCYKKEDEGQTPRQIVIKMKTRAKYVRDRL